MDHASVSPPDETFRWFRVLADTGPLAAIVVADALLEETWAATAQGTWIAAPLCVVLAYALTLAKSAPHDMATRVNALRTLIQRVRRDLRSQPAIRTALRELRELTGARQVLIALDAQPCPPLLLTDAAADDAGSPVRTLARDERRTYFPDWPSPPGTDDSFVTVAFETPRGSVHSCFEAAHPFDRLIGVAFRCGDEWEGRMYLLDPTDDPTREQFLRHVEQVLGYLLPALARVCELHVLRHRAAERERARLGRELHDGLVQSLANLDMELELVRIGSEPHISIRERLGRLQDRLRLELSNLRTLLHRARSHDIDSARLPAVLEELVDRFGRDTRVDAGYVSDISEVRLPPQVCGEIARIVQEALVNVRRHSGARHVLVTFSCDQADWKLSIQDDGRGFAGAPRTRPPSVIHERAHSIGGTVRVVAPGRPGARLEIAAGRHPWNPTA